MKGISSKKQNHVRTKIAGVFVDGVELESGSQTELVPGETAFQLGSCAWSFSVERVGDSERREASGRREDCCYCFCHTCCTPCLHVRVQIEDGVAAKAEEYQWGGGGVWLSIDNISHPNWVGTGPKRRGGIFIYLAWGLKQALQKG